MKLFVCALMLLTAGRADEDAKEEVAKANARVLDLACKKYYIEKSMWPAKLTDIADYLENGKKGLIDPWGNEYKYAAGKIKETDGTEIDRPYVWAERKVDGKIKVYGNKLPDGAKDVTPKEEKKPAEEKKKDDEKPTAEEMAAVEGVKAIQEAFKSYYLKNAGTWPARLEQVADLLANGKKSLIDPWGNEYKFAVVKKKLFGDTEVDSLCIWTERTVDGKTKVYGNKPPEKK